ncbi:MAG TPA: glucose 1-dehydrogenase [Acidimicrobiales bacterium]|nr:glucose 1-dehydrogenase [Acidimicrobiales bacterium]
MTTSQPADPGPRLSDRVAVITGGAGGIGEWITRRFAAAGAVVVANDIDAERLDSVTAGCVADGGDVTPVPGDIRDPEIVGALVAAAQARRDGRIDILVNNVGDFRPHSRFLDSTEDDWQAMADINLTHVLRCTHRIAPIMVSQGGGSIVNVTTVEVHRGIPGHVVYSAYKAAVLSFTRSLAVELGNFGVRVNAIAPDMADTLQTPADMMLRGRDASDLPRWIPLGRLGHPSDYADVVMFLASDDARFVTGQSLAVDGGTLAASGWYRSRSGRGWSVFPN